MWVWVWVGPPPTSLQIQVPDLLEGLAHSLDTLGALAIEVLERMQQLLQRPAGLAWGTPRTPLTAVTSRKN